MAAEPTRIKIRKGIIKDISDDITAEEIKNNYETIPPNISVIYVRRMKKRNKVLTMDEMVNGTHQKWINSNSFVVSFVGDVLPTEMLVFKVKLKVTPFVARPLQCFTCYKFEHVNKYCKSTPKCIKCGADKHESECPESVPKCINCGDAHQSIDSTCPLHIKYKKVYHLMAHENLSFKDAKEKIFSEQAETVAEEDKENVSTLAALLNNLKKEVIERLGETSNAQAQAVATASTENGNNSSSSDSEQETTENGAKSTGKKNNNKKKKKKGKSKKRRNF